MYRIISMQLKNLCDISSGYTARARLEPLPRVGTPVLQLRDVGPDAEGLGGKLDKYDLGKLPDRYFVQAGDVVFRSRGEPNTALAIGNRLPEPAAVISPLFILRADKERLLPEYLVWAINHPDAQRRLRAKAQGTSLRMISKAVLGNLDIDLPGLATQKQIADLDALARQEGSLLREFAARRESFVSAVLREVAKAAHQKRIA